MRIYAVADLSIVINAETQTYPGDPTVNFEVHSTIARDGFNLHHLIAAQAGVIAENLTNLAAIDFDEPLISLLPMAFEAAGGAPVRAVALQLAA